MAECKHLLGRKQQVIGLFHWIKWRNSNQIWKVQRWNFHEDGYLPNPVCLKPVRVRCTPCRVSNANERMIWNISPMTCLTVSPMRMLNVSPASTLTYTYFGAWAGAASAAAGRSVSDRSLTPLSGEQCPFDSRLRPLSPAPSTSNCGSMPV